jgi:hypothetical protein
MSSGPGTSCLGAKTRHPMMAIKLPLSGWIPLAADCNPHAAINCCENGWISIRIRKSQLGWYCAIELLCGWFK